MSKIKGSNAERELIHLFWANTGWASVRVAGSGSSSFPSPDIVAGNKKRLLAIECKAIKEGKRYIPFENITQLLEFSNMIGAEPWIAARYNNEEWYFLTIDKLEKTDTNYIISLENIKINGITFYELIGKYKQEKLI